MLNSELYWNDLQKLNERPLSWEKLESKNILITGGTGLIGSCLTDTLIYRNERLGAHIGIWVLCRNEARAGEVFGKYLKKAYFHLVVQDISEPLSLDEKIDYIIHAAGKGNPESFVTDPLGVMNANVSGMHWILEYAKKIKTTKILYLSSGETYGKMDLPGDVPISETMTGLLDSMNVRNCYGISKRAAETMCVSAAYEYQIPVCIARLCHIYGPTMTTGENRVIFQFLQKALHREEIVLKSEGLQKRSYCYVTDAAAALFTLLFRGKEGEAYNIANEKSAVTIRGLAEILGSYADRGVKYEQQTELERRGNSGIMHAVLDNRKLLELGVQMEYDIETGLKQTLEILEELR